MALSKINELRLYYSLYFVLKRFKDLLVGRKIILESRVGAIVTKYKESTEVNPNIGKWYVTIHSFDIEFSASDNKEFAGIMKLIHNFADIAVNKLQIPFCTIDDINLMTSTLKHEPTKQRSLTIPWYDNAVFAMDQCQLRGVDRGLGEVLRDILKAIGTHQAADPFCQKVMQELRNNSLSLSFIIESGTLYKLTKDEHKLLVVPEHVIPELVKYFHQAYCHPGVNKTMLIVKRQFYHKGLEKAVTNYIRGCIECKHNKINNQKCNPKLQPVEANAPGELVCADIFGPLPVKKGGVIAIFSTLDRLSGYTVFVPIRSMKAECLVNALRKVVEKYVSLGIQISTVLSDNGKQFRSRAWGECCFKLGIKAKFTSPYSPNVNAVERAHRDLAEKLRLRINSFDHKSNDHTKWCSELSFIQDTLNATPKNHLFTPNQILGIYEQSRDPSQSIPIICPNPFDLAKDRARADELDVNQYSFQKKQKASVFSFNLDPEGYVHVACDGTESGSASHKTLLSGFAVWFGNDHGANQSKILIPPTTSNRSEIFAILRALETAFANRVTKLWVHTDSEYVADLYNNSNLSDDNPKFMSYKNYDLLKELATVTTLFDSVKISHINGHTIDFGNLEADYLATNTVANYIDCGHVFSQMKCPKRRPLLSMFMLIRKSRIRIRHTAG